MIEKCHLLNKSWCSEINNMCSKRLVIDSMVGFLVESPSSLVLVETFHVASSLSPRLVRQYAGLVFFSGVKTIDTILGFS